MNECVREKSIKRARSATGHAGFFCAPRSPRRTLAEDVSLVTARFVGRREFRLSLRRHRVAEVLAKVSVDALVDELANVDQPTLRRFSTIVLCVEKK